MKVKLTITMEVPDVVLGMSDAEIRQNVFDDVVNFAEVEHRTWAVRWMAKNQPTLSEHHSLWGDIINKASFEIEKL